MAKSLTVTAANDDDGLPGTGEISLAEPSMTRIDVPVAEVDDDTSGPVLTGSHADRIAGLTPLT